MLNKDDRVVVEWRIVPLQAAQPDEAAVAWITMTGIVTDIEDTNQRGEPSAVIVEYFTDVAGVRSSQGTYGLPPQELEGAFIELKRLERLAPALPTIHQILGRKRERTPPAQQFNGTTAQQPTLKELVEAVKGEEVVAKTSVCVGLRVVEDEGELWAPFNIFTWYNLLRYQQDDGGREAVVAQWRMSMLQSMTDSGIHATQVAANVLRSFNDARDQFARWLRTCGDITLTTKRTWEFGFFMIFNVAAALVTIVHGFNRGDQLRFELKAEFNKPAAVIDIATHLSRIFRGRVSDREPPPPKHNNTGKRRAPFNNNSNSSQQRQLGTDQPTGHKDERQCRRCKKYHVGSNPNNAGAFWSTHKCQ